MKFLIDNALSPKVSDQLKEAGFDSVHVRERGLAEADDLIIFDLAAKEGRIIVSADTDFGTILALRKERVPSVILFRGNVDRWPDKQAERLLANLDQLKEPLSEGCIATIELSRVRVRQLPIQD